MIPGTPFIPGPRFVSKRRKRICTQTGIIVAHVHNPPHRMNGDAKRLAREQAIATAHLIAAAPDLYAALIETLEIAARNEDGDFRIRARNALAKGCPLTETEILYAKGEVNHPVNGPTTTEQVCENNWHIVGVGDQASGNFNLLIGHPQYPQSLNHSDLQKLNAKALGVQSCGGTVRP